MTHVEYRVRPVDPERHLIEVEVRAPSPDGHVDLAMPAWRPGRYIFQNFAGRVQQFEAASYARIDKDTWRVFGEGTVEARYRCYANVLDAGGSVCDRDELYVNGISTLMAVRGRLDLPCSVALERPSDWRLATALEERDGRLHAASYHELVDSPLIASPTLSTTTFTVDGLRCHLHIQGEGNYDTPRLHKDLTRIIREQAAIFGGVPIDDYHFLYHLVPYRFSHGVEHARGASMVIGPAGDFDITAFYDRFLSLAAHELFHIWNVKRFRPDALSPYDYWTARCTPLLWVVEGVTSYYGDLTLARTEQWTRARWFEALGEEITTVRNAAGYHVRCLEEASVDTWNSGYGNASPTSAVSFYTQGEVVAWLLDLELRHGTEGRRSLDDVMRGLDAAFGDGARGYSRDDFEAAVDEVAGRPMKAFFEGAVRGTNGLPIEDTLARCGLEVVRTVQRDRPEASLGITVDDRAVRAVHPNGPAAGAGLQTGDVLLTFDGRRACADTLPRLLASAAAGGRHVLRVLRHDRERTMEVVLSEGVVAKYEVRAREPLTPAQRRFVDAWLAPVARCQTGSRAVRTKLYGTGWGRL